MSIGIYKITSPSNKVYIGQSRNIEKRFLQYKGLYCKKQTKLYNSLLKYGAEDHKFEIVQEFNFEVTQDVLDKYEKFYISQYKESGTEMLNIRSGGKAGYFLYKRLLSSIYKGKNHPNYGKKASEETRKKMSESQKGKSLNEKHRQKISESNKGKLLSEEAKLKISNSLKGKPGRNTGNKHSEKTKKQISESKKGQLPPNMIKVYQYDINDNFIKEWQSASEAARSLNLHASLIRKCCIGNRKTTGGFKWKEKK